MCVNHGLDAVESYTTTVRKRLARYASGLQWNAGPDHSFGLQSVSLWDMHAELLLWSCEYVQQAAGLYGPGPCQLVPVSLLFWSGSCQMLLVWGVLLADEAVVRHDWWVPVKGFLLLKSESSLNLPTFLSTIIVFALSISIMTWENNSSDSAKLVTNFCSSFTWSSAQFCSVISV